MPSAVILHDEADTHTAKIYQAALLGVVLWDWLTSLRSEYRHVWKGRASVFKGLYIISRYLCLVLTILVFAIQFLDLPLEQCHSFVRANCMALTVIQVTSISVLTQRVWAVFLNQKYRYFVIGVLLLLDVATLVFGIVHAAVAVEASSSPMVDGRGFCQVEVYHKWMGFTAVFFVMPILAHTVATAAVAYAVQPLPNTNAVKRLLLVDGLLYLVGVNSVGILQIIFFYQTLNESLRMLNSAALLSLTAVFCCRFMLHLREEAEDIHRHPFGHSPVDSSELAKFSSIDNEKHRSGAFSFARRNSAQPGHIKNNSSGGNSKRSGDSGTMTIISEPETLVSSPSSKEFAITNAHKISFVTVEHKVEQHVEHMTDIEKGYSDDSRRSRKESENDDSFDSNMPELEKEES